MPGKWRVTAGGASAQQKADRLRSRADKLGRQATAWESGAEREPAVGKRLADLPAGFTVLHDLRLPGTESRLDHFVVSAGGAYLVDAKKYSGRLVYSKKMLWHGRFPIVDKLETLVWEAETLSEIVGREVVPVMCFADANLPQPVTTLGSVIVCRASVLHTVVRSTHATMSATELARVLDVAVQLAAPRRAGEVAEVVPGLRAAVSPPEPPSEPAHVPFPPTAGIEGLSDEEFWTGPHGVAAVTATGQTPAISTIPPISGPDALGGPVKEPVNRRWPRRVVVLFLGAVLVTAAVIGVWKVSQKSEKSRIEAENAPATTAAATRDSTTSGTGDDPDGTDGTDGTEVEATTTTLLDLTRAGFSVSCPVPGAGWSLRPIWPGDQDNLAWYAFSFQQFDASFQQFATMTSPEFTQYTPTAVPSANARTIRIQAVFNDGRVGDPVITTWTAPADEC